MGGRQTLMSGATSNPSTPSAERPVIVRTINLRKEYRMGQVLTQALRGITVEIYRGEFLCVMGPSGSGKSTFFNMVGGLDSPSSGRVFIDEVDVAQLSAIELAFLRCRKIGYIFQQYNLVQYMTALENVTVPMAFAGLDTDEARERGLGLLDLVGLKERWFHKPVEMSGGQQQRVAIARALIGSPAIILADEPTGALDTKTGEEIMDLFRRLNREEGITMVIITHNPGLAEQCGRYVKIIDGMIYSA
jgi:putative ABC transport system ATP-binding protein